MESCPNCHAIQNQVKAGRNQSGSQRYLCKECNRSYTPKPKPIGHSVAIRKKAVNMYREGSSYRAIARQLDVGTQSVINWVRAYHTTTNRISTQYKSQGTIFVSELKGE
jgi:transposase-like protein